MSRCDLVHNSARLDGEGGAARWFAAAILFVLLWAVSAVGPAQAVPGVAPQPTHQQDLGSSPRQAEAALPDLVDTAHPSQVDTDIAVPLRNSLNLPTAIPVRAPVRLSAAFWAPARAFDPRAPPSLR